MEDLAQLGHYIGQLFESVKGESDPGYPLRNHAKTKARAIESFREQIIECTIARLDLLTGEIPPDATPLWLLQRGYADAVRIFVKNEPHSTAKLEEQRVRLISSLSLVDELVARILYTVQNKTEIRSWENCPSKPGMGFTQEQTESLISYRNAWKLNESFDVSGWDWSVPDWLLDWDARARAALAHADENSLFFKACRNLAMVLGRSVFILANGDVYAQVWYGLMKSGWYNTSSTNSRMLFMIALSAGAEHAAAAGDDHIAAVLHLLDYMKRMLGYGFRVKHSPQNPDTFDFCSHLYRDGKAHTLNVQKITFALLCKKGSKEERADLFDDWHRDMENHPDLEFWDRLVRSCGWLEGPLTLAILPGASQSPLEDE